MSSILKQLNEIFIDILEDETIVLNTTTTAKEIESWNSLNHVVIIVAIEKHYKISFTSKEIYSWNNLGEMIQSIEEKLG